MQLDAVQIFVFVLITGLIALATYWKCAGAGRRAVGITGEAGNKDYFLAGGGLSWVFVAGSITLTNLSTDQLVGMNGNQMLLLAWWELAAVAGLMILCFVFIPVYYKYNCTTTTQLLEKRYGSKGIRATISLLFLLGNIFMFLPAVLYTGSLFMQTLFGLEVSLYVIAAIFAIIGSAYAIFGGLRAVAVSDTYSGVLLLGMALVVVFLSLSAIDFDFSGIPKERLTLIGGPQSDIPWPTLLTGMIFIQTFYWSTNQTITQRAMASPSVKEAQKGILAAAGIRLLIVPAIVVLPGIVAFKLYGDIGDTAYARIVGDVLPGWMSGILAAAIAAAVLTTFNSILNSSAALYVCDLHEAYVNPAPNVRRLSMVVSISMVAIAFCMVPVYNDPDASIINTLQELYGLLSMPILAAFIVGLLFKGVKGWVMMVAVAFGVALYAFFTFIWSPAHYIHLMAVTLFATVGFALLLSLVTGANPRWDAARVFGRAAGDESLPDVFE